MVLTTKTFVYLVARLLLIILINIIIHMVHIFINSIFLNCLNNLKYQINIFVKNVILLINIVKLAVELTIVSLVKQITIFILINAMLTVQLYRNIVFFLF